MLPANLVVIKTPPGSAHLVGVALDQSQLRRNRRDICGDDTIFVACPAISDAQSLARKLRSSDEPPLR